MLDRLHTSLTLLGARTRTDFFIRAKFFAHVAWLSTSKVSPGFANTDKLKMNDSSHNYEELDEYPEKVLPKKGEDGGEDRAIIETILLSRNRRRKAKRKRK